MIFVLAYRLKQGHKRFRNISIFRKEGTKAQGECEAVPPTQKQYNQGEDDHVPIGYRQSVSELRKLFVCVRVFKDLTTEEMGLDDLSKMQPSLECPHMKCLP
jgi:hypothetical protein